MNSQTISSVAERVHSLDWQSLASSLDDHGCAIARILTESECDELAAMYDAEEHFRKRVVMARHGSRKSRIAGMKPWARRHDSHSTTRNI